MHCRRLVSTCSRIASLVCTSVVVATSAAGDDLADVAKDFSHLLTTVSKDTASGGALWEVARHSAVSQLDSRHETRKRFEVQQISTDATS